MVVLDRYRAQMGYQTRRTHHILAVWCSNVTVFDALHTSFSDLRTSF